MVLANQGVSVEMHTRPHIYHCNPPWQTNTWLLPDQANPQNYPSHGGGGEGEHPLRSLGYPSESLSV